MLNSRRATTSDSPLITAHRYAMFAEMGNYEESALQQMKHNFLPWVERMIAAEKYVGWIVEDAGQPVASAGFFQLEWPPHPLDPAGEHRGYLLNFWVDPPHRGKGVARSLVKIALAEAHQRGIKVVALHASDAGRPVYEVMGFNASNEMLHAEEELPAPNS